MSADTSGYQAPGTWSWPADLPKTSEPDYDSNTSSQNESSSNTTRERTTYSSHASKSSTSDGTQTGSQSNARSSSTSSSRQRYYRPRTCRICLETVQPTFHGPSEDLPGYLQGTPNVTYETDGDRLIRPCKCKGSSRYVHESCLQAWRHADPSYGARNFWKCPTCGFTYRLERMQWGHWISSKMMQLALTVVIFLTTVFTLGFIADPIISMYLSPVDTVMYGTQMDEFEEDSWLYHFVKGLASLGLLGFVKVFFSLGPWQWFNIRSSGIGSGGRGSINRGRDRLQNISWLVVILGVCSFLYTVWKGVRAWSRRVLEKARERVIDVQGPDEDDDDNDAAG